MINMNEKQLRGLWMTSASCFTKSLKGNDLIGLYSSKTWGKSCWHFVKLNYSQAISLHVRKFKNEPGKHFTQEVFVKSYSKFDKYLLENIERNY